jgi:hypothetical protein
MQLLALILGFCFISAETRAELNPGLVVAKVYDLNHPTTPEPVIFTHRVEFQNEGEKRTVYNSYSTPEGEVILSGVAVSQNGKLQSYNVEQKQIGEKFTLEVREGRLFYDYNLDGANTKDSTKVPDELVVAATLIDAIRSRWVEFNDGGSIRVRLAVPERQEDIGFKLFIDEGSPLNQDPERVVLRMRPTSIFVQALVKPIHFIMSKDGTRLYEYWGPSSLYTKKEGSTDWLSLEIRSIYPPETVPTPARLTPALPAP